MLKEIIEKRRKQPTEWKKIFANEKNDKELISKQVNSPYNSTSRKQTT